MLKEKIILVDDEPNILSGYRRSLHKHFQLETADSGRSALEVIKTKGPFSVIVSDMRMPSMDGVQLLEKVKESNPDIVRIMLTGNADQKTAINAVNKGSIFRFLNKPCSPEDLIAVLSTAVRQYRLVTAEKEILEKTLKGSVKILVDLLSLADPETFKNSIKLRSYIRDIGSKVGIKNLWELEVAAMLTPIGYLTLPPDLRAKMRTGDDLSIKEKQAVAETPTISNRLLSNIPRLENVAELINTSTDSLEELPESGERVKRVLFFRALTEFVEQENKYNDPNIALNIVINASTGQYLEVIKEIGAHLGQNVSKQQKASYIMKEVRVRDLLVGDIVEKNIETPLAGR